MFGPISQKEINVHLLSSIQECERMTNKQWAFSFPFCKCNVFRIFNATEYFDILLSYQVHLDFGRLALSPSLKDFWTQDDMLSFHCAALIR